MNTRRTHTLLMTLFLVLISQPFLSCTKEDMSDCPTGLQIKVQPDPTIFSTYANRYTIDSVVIHVFDASDDRYVTSWTGGKYTPGRDYIANIPLTTAGSYKFICWTNLGDFYKINHDIAYCEQNQPLSTNLHLYADYPADKIIRTIIPDLHYGAVTGIYNIGTPNADYTINLSPNTYKLNFTIKGLPDQTHTYGFEIKDNNSHYNFDNTIVAGRADYRYFHSTNTFYNSELKQSLIELKLDSSRSPLFTFSDMTTSTDLYSHDLVDLITRAYTYGGQTLNFTATYEFDIVLHFDSQMNVSITINGWNYSDSGGPLG